MVLIAAAVFAVWTVRRSFPQYDGQLTVAGLRSEVRVLRDEYGIPQIYADNAEDLFFAQGFVQAQDRFFQMDFRRHVASGRLSELFGEQTLDTDMVVRTLGWRRVAEQELPLLDPSTRRYLDAYSAGVNAYLADRSSAELSLEYALLSLTGQDYTPEEWTPADSLVWLKAMAWDLRGNMQDEIDRVVAATKLTRAQVSRLYPPYPYGRHAPILIEGAVVNGTYVEGARVGGTANRAAFPPSVVAQLGRIRTLTQDLPALLGTGEGIGSNAWAVSGERTSTGKPLLANDPHLAPSMPGIWYQMGLHCTAVTATCPFDVSGFTFAGLPGVVIGHNDAIAWGFTNLGADVTDLYVEQLRGDHYRYGRGERPLITREERITVAGRDRPVRLTVRATRHGPLLSDVSDEVARVASEAPVATRAPRRGAEYAVALRWTALDPGRTADAIFALDQARSWPEFRAAARLFDVPAQNLVYADTAGHIGYQAPGRIPIRHTGHGNWPVPGWDRAYEWSGYVPFKALPNVLDPEDGYVVTANQAVVGPSYPYYLGSSWAYGYRSQRIIHRIVAEQDVTIDEMAGIQLDTRSANAATLVPYLLDIRLDTSFAQQGQRQLRGWQFTHRVDSAPAAYFNVVWRNLLALTFHDQLPAAVWPDGGERWFEVVRSILDNPDSPWWDDISTPEEQETRDDILAEAMVLARDELTRLHARDPDRWSWGHLHQLELINPALGRSGIGVVEALVNRGPYELGGGSGLVNATGWTATEGYRVDRVPSMRMVVSLGDFDDSRWINLTGVSGHAFASHYTDQTELWVDGDLLPWAYDTEAVAAAAERTLVLRPPP